MRLRGRSSSFRSDLTIIVYKIDYVWRVWESSLGGPRLGLCSRTWTGLHGVVGCEYDFALLTT